MTVLLLASARTAAAQTITEFPIPTAPTTSIVAGADGALWFIEAGTNKIGRITTAGGVSEFPLPTPNSGLGGITAGPDAFGCNGPRAAMRLSCRAPDARPGGCSDLPIGSPDRRLAVFRILKARHISLCHIIHRFDRVLANSDLNPHRGDRFRR